MENLKSAKFNIGFVYNGINYIYNSRTATLAELDTPFTECIVNSKAREELLKNGFAVSENTDEISELLDVLDDEINKIPSVLELTVVLTEKCNFKCVYCYQTKNTKVFSTEDVTELVQNISILFDRGLDTLSIHYFGGEPLLNLPILRKLDKSLRKLCSEKNKNFQSYITTNGSLLTSKILKELNFTTIQLTFDGNINNHSMFKVSESFGYKDLLDTVNIVMGESNSNLRIRFNICKENADSFISVLDDIFALHNFDTERISFAFNPMRNFSDSDCFTVLLPNEYAGINLKLRKRVLNAGKKLILPKALAQPCKFTVGNALCIGPNGASYFCTSSFYDKNAENTIMNFLTKKKIRYSLPDICKRCVVLPMCLCSCKLLRPEKNACIAEKFIIVDLLKMYIDNPNMWEI